MDENTKAKFDEKIKELLSMAKKKKNVLEYQEVADFFADLNLEDDQMDKVFDFLEASGVDVLRITEDDEVPEEEIMLIEEEDVDVVNIGLSVLDGVSIEDPESKSLKCPCFPQRKKSNLPRKWKREIRKQKNVLRKQT